MTARAAPAAPRPRAAEGVAGRLGRCGASWLAAALLAGCAALGGDAPPAADTGKKTGALTYARFPADDETIRSMLAGAAPTEDERAKVWAEMDALLPAQKAE